MVQDWKEVEDPTWAEFEYPWKQPEQYREERSFLAISGCLATMAPKPRRGKETTNSGWRILRVHARGSLALLPLDRGSSVGSRQQEDPRRVHQSRQKLAVHLPPLLGRLHEQLQWPERAQHGYQVPDAEEDGEDPEEERRAEEHDEEVDEQGAVGDGVGAVGEDGAVGEHDYGASDGDVPDYEEEGDVVDVEAAEEEELAQGARAEERDQHGDRDDDVHREEPEAVEEPGTLID